MNMHQSPALAAVVVKQRQQELRNEAQRVHAANVAASANKERKGCPWRPREAVAASFHAVSAHRLSAATRRVEIRLAAACTAIGTRLVH
jgi:hypothetical protein